MSHLQALPSASAGRRWPLQRSLTPFRGLLHLLLPLNREGGSDSYGNNAQFVFTTCFYGAICLQANGANGGISISSLTWSSFPAQSCGDKAMCCRGCVPVGF